MRVGVDTGKRNISFAVSDFQLFSFFFFFIRKTLKLYRGIFNKWKKDYKLHRILFFKLIVKKINI